MKNKNGSATRSEKGRAGFSAFHIFCISLMLLFYVLTVVLLATDDFPGKEIIRKFTIPFFFTTYFTVALIEGLKTYSDKKRKIFNTLVCVGNAVVFLMIRFVVSDIVTFLILAVNTVLPIYYLCYFYSSSLITVVCSFVPLRSLLLRHVQGQALWPGLDHKAA